MFTKFQINNLFLYICALLAVEVFVLSSYVSAQDSPAENPYHQNNEKGVTVN